MDNMSIPTEAVSTQTKTETKTKTAELLEKMEAGEYVSDNEYLSSIPGYMEELDEALNEPWEECIPMEKVFENLNNE